MNHLISGGLSRITKSISESKNSTKLYEVLNIMSEATSSRKGRVASEMAQPGELLAAKSDSVSQLLRLTWWRVPTSVSCFLIPTCAHTQKVNV